MKFFAFSVTALMFLAVGVVASACGDDGGGGLSLEEYFAQLDTAQNEVDRRFEEFFTQEEPDPNASGEEVAAFAGEAIAAFVSILQDAQDTFAGVEPPAEAEDVHNDLVQAIEDARDALEAAADDVPATLSLEELEMFDPFEPATEAFERVEAACVGLQTIADDNSVDVDLECQEEE